MKCENCRDTGWYGDNGPGIVGNHEFHRCECGVIDKCTSGIHRYVEVGGIPWCRACDREADTDICRLNALPEPCPKCAAVRERLREVRSRFGATPDEISREQLIGAWADLCAAIAKGGE